LQQVKQLNFFQSALISLDFGGFKSAMGRDPDYRMLEENATSQQAHQQAFSHGCMKSGCSRFCKSCWLILGIPAAAFNAYLVHAAHPSQTEMDATTHLLGNASCDGLQRIFGETSHDDAAMPSEVRPLFFVRHVQSEANVDGLGHLIDIDPTATHPKGQEQAAEAGRAFKHWLLDRCSVDLDAKPVKAHITVSQLQRTHETAAILASAMGLGRLADGSLAACPDMKPSSSSVHPCYLTASVDPRLNEMCPGFDNTWSSFSQPCKDVEDAVARKLCHDMGLDQSVSAADPWWRKWWHQAFYGSTYFDPEPILKSQFETKAGILPIIVTHESFEKHLAGWLARNKVDTSTPEGAQFATELTRLSSMHLGNAMVLKLDLIHKEDEADTPGYAASLGVVASGGAGAPVDSLWKPLVWLITAWGIIGLIHLCQLLR